MRTHRTSGFTLIEAIITLAILAIAGMMALPEFGSVLANRRAATATDDLFATFYYARSEAIRLNQSVTIQAIDDDWSNGWEVPDPVNAGQFLLQHANRGLTVVEASSATSVVYLPSGRLAAGTAPSFSLCDEKSRAKERVLRVDLSGMPNISVPGACP